MRTAALDSLTRQEYLRAAGFLEVRAPYLERRGQAQLAQLTRGIAYICRQRAARLQLQKLAA
jgi:hypothetical protein